MRVLVSAFAPIYWTTVLQRGAARNGYSFTHGQFRQESQLEFDTGESAFIPSTLCSMRHLIHFSLVNGDAKQNQNQPL